MIEIDHEHRLERRNYLAQYDLLEPPVELKEPSKKECFEALPFTTRDLYELYLCDLVRAMPDDYHRQFTLRGTLFRDLAIASAVAWAHGTMLTYLITRREPC